MSTRRLGFIYGIAAYLCWGAFPLFFMLLAAVDPFEAVPWRVITALGFCVIAVTVVRSWGSVLQILRSPRMLGWFALCTVLLYANWQIFVFGIVTGHIIETSLGYFINPLVTILIGVFVRKEKLSRAQWLAVGIAAVGVIISAAAYGQFPFIALGQLGLIFWLTGHLGAFDHGPAVTIPLLLSGVATAIPLLLFAAGNRGLPLSYMGFIQFFTPVLGFLTGYFIFHEAMSPARWIGFLSVWVALIVLIWDMLARLRRRGSPGDDPHPGTDEIVVQHGA